MQYKIPQNVRREDQIVGPLTLKQLVILGVGGGITYALYIFMSTRFPTLIWAPAVIVPGLLTLALALLNINGIPFHKWVLLGGEYSFLPRKRTFSLGAGDIYSETLFKKRESKIIIEDDGSEAARSQKMKKLSEISKIVDVSHQTK